MKATKDYGEQYDDAEAVAYQDRKPGKHAAELRLIDRPLPTSLRTQRVLDIPCGGGRVMMHLASLGYPVAGVHISGRMLRLPRAGRATRSRLFPRLAGRGASNVSGPPFRHDYLLSIVPSFSNSRSSPRAVSELCRVAAKNVVLSYFNPASLSAFYFNLRRGNSRPYPRAQIRHFARRVDPIFS